MQATLAKSTGRDLFNYCWEAEISELLLVHIHISLAAIQSILNRMAALKKGKWMKKIDAQLFDLCRNPKSSVEQIRKLLAEGANPNFEVTTDWDHESEGEAVLDRKKKVVLANKSEMSPDFMEEEREYSMLMVALEVGHSNEIISLLLEKGADTEGPHTLDRHEEWSYTPLIIALQKSAPFEVIQTLLKYDANTETIDGTNTPAMIAMKNYADPEVYLTLSNAGSPLEGNWQEESVLTVGLSEDRSLRTLKPIMERCDDQQSSRPLLVCAQSTTRPNVFAALLEVEDGFYTDENKKTLEGALHAARNNPALKNHAVLQRLEEIIKERSEIDD